LPTDGIVRATATEITKDSKTDVEKARAIYEWIVEKHIPESEDARLRARGYPLHA